ncbi:MAG: DUF362 domain-containing protein [Anaerolineales bacterium]|nr:DUF362 domain-containing protein [Anaerolineales bacterium]
MKSINRRAFIRWMALQFGVLMGGEFLASCRQATGPLPTSGVNPKGTSKPTAIVPDDPTETGETNEPSPTVEPTETSPPPALAVARGGEPEDLVRAALAALGGIERFVQAGDRVVVKPNICVAYHTYEYAATTNPWVVGELVSQCLQAGADRVLVMDYPFGGTSEQAYIKSGIQEQVLAAGGEMDSFSPVKFVMTDISQGIDLQTCDIYDDVLTADVVINVPIAKHHGLAKLTLGMKNLMGVIKNRPYMHQNLGQKLADLSSRVMPTLTVVDAVRILTYGGPSGGSLDAVKKLDTVIASPDIVAADSYAATLFGMEPTDLGYVNAGNAMGIGTSDLSSLRIEEISLGG